jgi:nitroreductase
MEFDEVISKRKSVRDFKKINVSYKDILAGIESAIQGPFAGGLNNLKFIIVEDPEKIDRISEFCQQSWINQSQAVIVVCSDDTHLEYKYGERGRVYSRQQAGAAVMAFTLKMTELGIGSCWVGAYTDELIKQLLGIPGHIQVEAMISLGYEKKKDKKTEKSRKKKSVESSIYWEGWDSSRRPTIFQESDTHLPPVTHLKE